MQEFWSQELDRIQNKVLVSKHCGVWASNGEELKTGVNPEGLELSDVHFIGIYAAEL